MAACTARTVSSRLPETDLVAFTANALTVNGVGRKGCHGAPAASSYNTGTL